MYPFYRVDGIVERPSQKQVLDATGGFKTELDLNEECLKVHRGEDGPGYDVLCTRRFFIEEQNTGSAEWLDWMYSESMEMSFLGEEN